MKRKITKYDEAVAYLLDLPRFTGKNTMEDTKSFLEKLGSPDRGLEIIHVAGTNGKGSVCAYLRCALEAAGYRVGVFTSPHLVDIRERFFIEGHVAAEEDFLQAFLRIYELLDWSAIEAGGGYHPTFFEYLFFIAMLLFAKAGPDYCILETGLGGRLDATNSVSCKRAAVITSIGLDHTQQLGETREQIAGEKAGIIQAGAPCVYTEGNTEGGREIARVIEGAAKKAGSPAFCLRKDQIRHVKKHKKGIDFSLKSEYDDYHRVTVHTGALYQIENAALAIRTLEVIGLWDREREEILLDGIAACAWPGRMEEVEPGIFVDGAHNMDGVEAFLQAVAADGVTDGRLLLFGAVSDKDYGQMLGRILRSGLFVGLGLTPLRSGRSASAEELKAAVLSVPAEEPSIPGGRAALEVYSSAREAYEDMKRKRRSGQSMYVAGSLYLVGEIKEYLKHD